MFDITNNIALLQTNSAKYDKYKHLDNKGDKNIAFFYYEFIPDCSSRGLLKF